MSDWREAAIEAGWAQHDMVRAAILSDLRAKVEALRRPPAHPTRPTSNGPHCQCNPCVSNRALDRVLALLDAAQHRELVDGNSQPLEQVASRVRAEVAALRERFRFSEYPNGKVRSLIVDGTHWVSVAYANCQEDRGAEKARREVLADLRAEAMNLPSRVELNEVGDEVTWVRYRDVLALIEEVQRD